jgi:hypothetical protein
MLFIAYVKFSHNVSISNFVTEQSIRKPKSPQLSRLIGKPLTEHTSLSGITNDA